MTRWAFVSDVHGNRAALAEAERLALAAGADAFVSLGDVIGRGDPESCVTWVQDVAALAVVGNRDLDHLERVAAAYRAIVGSWAHEARASDLIATHGDPRLHRPLSSAAERDGFRRALAYLEVQDARVWFFGHTHRSRCWELADGEARPLDPAYVKMREGARYVVNVGTTGLPLPGRGGAAFVIYDDAAHTIGSLALARFHGPARAKPYAMISEALQRGR